MTFFIPKKKEFWLKKPVDNVELGNKYSSDQFTNAYIFNQNGPIQLHRRDIVSETGISYDYDGMHVDGVAGSNITLDAPIDVSSGEGTLIFRVKKGFPAATNISEGVFSDKIVSNISTSGLSLDIRGGDGGILLILGAGLLTCTTTNYFGDLQYHNIIVLYSVNNVSSIFIDGKEVNYTIRDISPSSITPSINNAKLGAYYSDATSWRSKISLDYLYSFNKRLSLDEAKYIQSAPYQILKPRKKYYIFGTVTTLSTLAPSLNVGTSSIYSPSVSSSTTLVSTLLTNTSSFPPSTISLGNGLSASVFVESPAFPSPQVTASYNLSTSVYTNNSTLLGGTVSKGNNLSPTTYTNLNTLQSPVVSTSVSLSATLFTDSANFYPATIALSSGPHTLTAGLLANSSSFYPVIASSTNSLVSSLYTNSSTLHTPLLSKENNLLPTLVTNKSTILSPLVSGGEALAVPTLFQNSSTFLSASVSAGAVGITASLFNNSTSFYSAVVNTGTTLVASIVTNANGFYPTQVSASAPILSETKFVNQNIFFNGTVTQVANAHLFAYKFANQQTYYSSNIYNASTLSAFRGEYVVKLPNDYKIYL